MNSATRAAPSEPAANVTMMRRARFLLRLVVVIVAVLAVWDGLLFRSGLYYRWLEPQSTAGTTRNALKIVRGSYAPERRNVLVLGNSQVGEGFSQELADKASAGSGLHFLNAAIPGTDPRVWYYLLRQIDPDARRFAAVVLPAPYDASTQLAVRADYPLDIAYLTPLLRLGDLVDLPSTFDDPSLAARARRAILFPAQPLRDDISALLAAPADRIQHLRSWRKHYLPSFLRYPGHAEALPELALDPHTLQPVDWGVDEATLKPRLSAYFASLGAVPTAATRSSNERYSREWLTRIAAPYRAHGIPVILITVPRGPWHAHINPPQPAGVVAELIAAGVLTALPADSFVELEQPRYFFDSLHMNRVGRERFSALLAQRVAALLH